MVLSTSAHNHHKKQSVKFGLVALAWEKIFSETTERRLQWHARQKHDHWSNTSISKKSMFEFFYLEQILSRPMVCQRPFRHLYRPYVNQQTELHKLFTLIRRCHAFLFNGSHCLNLCVQQLSLFCSLFLYKLLWSRFTCMRICTHKQCVIAAQLLSPCN